MGCHVAGALSQSSAHTALIVFFFPFFFLLLQITRHPHLKDVTKTIPHDARKVTPKELVVKEKERGALASGKRRRGQERNAEADEDMLMLHHHM